MKFAKVFFSIFFSLCLIFISVTPVFGSQIISKIPEPQESVTDFYFSLGSSLLHFVFPYAVDSYTYEASQGFSSYDYSPYQVRVSRDVISSGSNAGMSTFTFSLTNDIQNLSVSCHVYLYTLADGAYVRSWDYTIPSSSTVNHIWTPIPQSAVENGYWKSSNIHLSGNGFSNVPLKQIAWSDTIDYSTDFGQLETLITATNSYLNSIDSRFLSFDTYLRSHFDIALSDINDTVSFLYAQFVQYRVQFSQEAATIEGQLDEIISLLGGGQTTQALDPETGFANSVDEYQSQESSLLNGVDNRVNEMNDLVSSADGQLEGLADGFTLVKNVFYYFIEEQSLPFTLLFFSLVFGLFITLIGKKVA